MVEVELMNLEGTRIPVSKQAQFYAALDDLRNFKKKPVLGRCMFWPSDCNDTPISSHLISESWLRQIADSTNHVVQLQLVTNNIAQNGAGLEARRVGVGDKKAVTFPGFCSRHDATLFRCLEQSAFCASPEQLLALTYRSTCREACAKHQMVACHLPIVTGENAPVEMGIQTASEMKNCIELLTWKQDLEAMLVDGKNELAGYVIQFGRLPTVSAATTVSFPQTFTGRKLDARYDWITLSIVPSKNAGFAAFTWGKRASKNASLLVKSFRNIPRERQSAALLNLILEVSESLYIAPDWWNSLSQPVQNGFMGRFSRSIVTGNPAPPAEWLIPKQRPIVDWNIVNAGYL